MNDLASKIKAAYRLPASRPTPAPTPKAKAPAKPKPAGKAKQEPPPPKLKGSTQIKRSCGHTEPLGAIKSRACPACKRERSRARRTNKVERRRLPGGSVVAGSYDAATETWTLALTVEGQVFQGRGPTLFGTLHLLDSLYRNAVRQQEEQEAAAEPR
jgi:hypothetical protein